MIITVDFDDTLTRTDVSSFVVEQIKKGNQVICVTSRYSETMSNRLFGKKNTRWNSDLIEYCEKIGISKIYFTNGGEKYITLQKIHSDLHLDDNSSEIKSINENLNKTIALNIKTKDWQYLAKSIFTKTIKI